MIRQWSKVAVLVSKIVLVSAMTGGLVLETASAQAAQAAADFADAVAGDLAAGRFALVVARMNAEMAGALPKEKLAEVWRALTGQFGPCAGIGEISSEAKGGLDVIRVPLKFRSGVLDLKLSVTQRIVGLFIVPHEAQVSAWSSPAYADAEKFRDIEVRFGREPFMLPGNLSLPNSAGKAPAVIVVHGSGPQDRDESLGPNRPFRDIAFGLATRGIAVLRYDKRTKVYPEAFAGLKAPTVKEEALDDVALAVEFLKARPDIDASRITVIGHSLGGTLAPRLAAANPDVSRIVILAGATRPLQDIVVEQTEYLASLQGAPNEAAIKSMKALKIEAASAKAARPGDEGPAFFDAPLSYWADLNVYDPAEVAASLTIPMLILQGGRDYQVTSADFSRFRSALKGHDNATCILLPALNHQFVSGTGRSTPADYQTPAHVDAGAIELIASFVLSK